MSGSDLARRLLDDCRIATLSGMHFGRDDQELILRLALVDFDGSEALKAIGQSYEIDDQSLESYCSNVVNAIKGICEWIIKNKDLMKYISGAEM